MAKAKQNLDSQIKKSIVNESNEYFKEFYFTNGKEYIYFNQNKDHGTGNIFIEKVEQKEEQTTNTIDIPGFKVTEQVENQNIIQLRYKKQYLTLKLNAVIPDYFVILFLSFYYGYVQQSFKIIERTENKVVYKILDNPQQIEPIQREQYFQIFMRDYNLFYMFCPQIQDIRCQKNKTLTVYQIENNIYDYKEIFDCINTINTNVLMIQYDEYFKGNKDFIAKNFAIFPYLGKNTLGMLLYDDNKIQIQIIQFDKLYVVNVFNDFDEIIKYKNIYELPIVIKKQLYKRYQYLINFQNDDNFINNFKFLNPRKQSNSQYYITIGNKQLSLFQRHNMIQCQGKFDSEYESSIYMTIIKNIGNFEISQYQQPTIQDLQFINPFYFGKSLNGNYEKQLENMNKRPTLKYIDYFDGKYPSYLKKYIQKIDKINNKDKSDNTEIQLEKGTTTQFQEILRTSQNEDEKYYYNKLKDFYENGIDIVINKNDVYENSNQKYITFKCTNEYPYININYQQNYIKSIYYIGCQLTPIKFSSINLYVIYFVYSNILLKTKENQQFLDFLQKQLQNIKSITPIKYYNLESVIYGRCIRLLPELQQIFKPDLLMLCVKDIQFDNYIIYDQQSKQFYLKNDNNDKDKELYIYVFNMKYFILIEPKLSDKQEYIYYQYNGKYYNNNVIEMEDSDIPSFIKTKNGLMPKWYYSNYMYKKSTKKLSNKWPTKEFIDSLNLDIVNKIINVDKQLIGYQCNDNQQYKNIYFQSIKVFDNVSSQQYILGKYPDNQNQIQNKYYLSILQIATILIVLNRNKIINKNYNFNIDKQYFTTDQSYGQIYNNILSFITFKINKQDYDNAIKLIKEMVSQTDDIESFVINTNLYINNNYEFNYFHNYEQILQISPYLQEIDDIFLE